jgi:iron complex transport system substrate-binding protein
LWTQVPVLIMRDTFRIELQFVRLAVILFAVTSIMGCTEKRRDSENQSHEIKDYYGKTLPRLEKVMSVVPLYYVQAEVIVCIGARNKIVGVGYLLPNNQILNRFYPDIYEIPQVGRDITLNVELLCTLQPDLVLCSNNLTEISKIENAGMNAFGTYPRNLADVFQQIQDYGTLLGRKVEADSLVNFLSGKIEQIRKVTESIPSESRPRVYYVRSDNCSSLGAGIFSEVINIVGGVNVVDNGNIGGGNTVRCSIEQLLAWDPDVIIIRDRASTSIEEILTDPEWQEIAAVKTKRVYQETYGWTEFRIETVFGISEKAKWLYPELFTKISPIDDYGEFNRIIEGFYR